MTRRARRRRLVAAHVTTVRSPAWCGGWPVQHGTALDESALRLMPRPAPPDADVVRRRGARHRSEAARRRPPSTGTARCTAPARARLGVPILTGTDIAGTLAREVALLAEHGLAPAAALAAATTTGYRFLGEPFDQPGRPATLVTYQHDPREDLAVLASPSAVLIDGVRVR